MGQVRILCFTDGKRPRTWKMKIVIAGDAREKFLLTATSSAGVDIRLIVSGFHTNNSCALVFNEFHSDIALWVSYHSLVNSYNLIAMSHGDKLCQDVVLIIRQSFQNFGRLRKPCKSEDELTCCGINAHKCSQSCHTKLSHNYYCLLQEQSIFTAKCSSSYKYNELEIILLLQFLTHTCTQTCARKHTKKNIKHNFPCI